MVSHCPGGGSTGNVALLTGGSVALTAGTLVVVKGGGSMTVIKEYALILYSKPFSLVAS